MFHLEPALACGRHRTRVRTAADVVRGSAGSIDVNAMIEAGVTDDLTEDGLRERRTTDVAETDEEYADALTL